MVFILFPGSLAEDPTSSETPESIKGQELN